MKQSALIRGSRRRRYEEGDMRRFVILARP
jgi:hypothetical protein